MGDLIITDRRKQALQMPTDSHLYCMCHLSLTAFVGSATLGMIWFASPLAGYVCDRFSCRITTFLGGLLCATGLVATSFVQSITHMYFTYSFILGLGACFICNSCYLVIGQYFEKKLSTATGIVSLGASLGVLYTGPLLQILLDAFGWRESLRIMTAFYGVICILSLAFSPNVDNNTPKETNLENDNEETKDEEKKGISLYCSVWKFPTFTAAAISFVAAGFGMYTIYISLVSCHYSHTYSKYINSLNGILIVAVSCRCSTKLASSLPQLCYDPIERVKQFFLYFSQTTVILLLL